MGEDFRERDRIPNHIAFQMILVAGFYDLLFLGNSFLYPFLIGFFLAPFIWLLAWLTFYVWLKIHDVGILDIFGKYALRKTLAITLKGLPGLPSWTFGTFLTISAVKAEDVIYNKLGAEVELSARTLGARNLSALLNKSQ